jgi:serine phosphatase RsbU (regulator of sigma subunit)
MTGFILLDFLISGLLGTFLYKVSETIYFQSFIEHKLSLARSISYTFNGIDLNKLAEPNALKLDKFWEIYNHIVKIEKKEKHVVWIFALFYDRDKEEMRYAIDGTIFDLDTLWIENKNFGFQFYKNPKEEYVIRWNASEESLPFKIENGDLKFLFELNPNTKVFSINGQKLFKIQDKDSLSFEIENTILDKNNRDYSLKIDLYGKKEELVFSFAEKNSLSSVPGLPLKEDKNLLDRFKVAMNSCTDYIPKDLERTSYGLFLYTGANIKDPNGQCNGLLLVTSDLKDVYYFRSKLLYSAIGVSVFTFAITLIVAYLLSNYISNPLNKLSIAVQEVSAGNLGTILEITSGDEFEYLAKEFNTMTESLRNANTEKIRLISMEKELSLAKKIQDSALPKSIPKFSGLGIHVLYKPMELVGGDYYDFCIIDSNRIGILIADVAGHGVSAAIIASMLSIAFKNHFNYAEFPEIMLSRINRTMLGKCGNMFLTAAYLVIDMDNMVASFANAGHPFGYLYRAKSNEFFSFDSKGRLMGVFPELHSAKMEISIEKEDRIIFFTDGIIEARSKKNELFDEERLKAILASSSNLSSSELNTKILTELETWQGSNVFEDDLTLIIIDC